MVERRSNAQHDPPLGPDPGSHCPDASTSALVRYVLASRQAELRNAEMALEVELLRRKLDLHRRYTLSLNSAVETALHALCQSPQLSAELTEQSDSRARFGEDQPSGRQSAEQKADAEVPGGRPAQAGSDEGGEGFDKSGDRIARTMNEAEARAASLLKEASDVLSRAQESAREILERALAQGSEIVAKAEEQSRHVDEKVTEVEAVTAPSGSTIYQKALELARRQGQGSAEVEQDSRESGEAPASPMARAPLAPPRDGDPRPVYRAEQGAKGENQSMSAESDPSGRSRSGGSGNGGDGFPGRQNGNSVTTVGISSLKTFAPVVSLEQALRTMSGVRQVRVLSFKGGMLEMVVEHDAQVPLSEALQSLGGYQFRVLDSSDGRLSLELASSDE